LSIQIPVPHFQFRCWIPVSVSVQFVQFHVIHQIIPCGFFQPSSTKFVNSHGILNPLELDQSTAQLSRTYTAPAFLASLSHGWTSEGSTTTRSIRRMGRYFIQWVDTSVPLLNYGQGRFYAPEISERDSGSLYLNYDISCFKKTNH